MPKLTKEVSAPVSRELPMPKYEYQTPANGSFTYRYEDSEEAKEAKPDLCLQNLKFAV